MLYIKMILENLGIYSLYIEKSFVHLLIGVGLIIKQLLNNFIETGGNF